MTNRERIMQHFSLRLDIMFNSALKALETRQATKGGLIDGVANCQFEYSKGDSITGNYINYVMALAYSCSEVNASMGKICASPTAGSCGILPGALLAAQEQDGFTDDELVMALFTAAGLENTEIFPDLAGIPRVVLARK